MPHGHGHDHVHGGHEHSHSGGHAHGHAAGEPCYSASPALVAAEQGTSGRHTASAGNSSGENINLRGAVIHIMGDLVQSIGVAAAGALIWYKQVPGSRLSMCIQIASPCQAKIICLLRCLCLSS